MNTSQYALLAVVLISMPTAAITARSVENDRLEEVIVTANYRESTLMNAVGSISVVGRETISERAAQHLEEVLNAVPNVTWASASSRSRFVQVAVRRRTGGSFAWPTGNSFRRQRPRRNDQNPQRRSHRRF